MSKKYAFWFTLRPQSAYCRQGEAEARILKNHMVRVSEGKSDCYWLRRSLARYFDFKTTWSEFHKPSQTATERGEAELRLLYFKTTWSEFQKGSPTAAERGKAKLRIFDFKTTWSEF